MKNTNDNTQTVQKQVESRILAIRGQKVILDADLADLYGVTTKRLKEQVKRNNERFPDDFVFILTTREFIELKSQFADSDDDMNRSQIATGSVKHRDPRYPPMAFTEHGAMMAANVLNSKQAVQMSVFVVRAFVKMREQFAATQELARRLAEIEKTLIVHDSALVDLYEEIRPLLLPPKQPRKLPIGFQAKDRRAKYRTKKTTRKRS